MREMKVYLNGEFVEETEAKVSAFDHGFLYGDGVFEGIRAYNRKIFRLKEHIDRLYECAKAIDLEISLSKDEMRGKIVELCRLNNLNEAYIRPIVSRGIGDLGLDPRKCGKPTVVILEKEMKPLLGEGELKVITVFWRRNAPDALSPNIKSLNYLNNILGKLEANRHGANDCLFLDKEGYISEGTGENFFMVKNGVLITPPTLTNLKGITRNAIIEMANSRGYKVKEGRISLFDAYNADEVFLCGTAAEVAPVVSIDGREIGSGKVGRITLDLKEAYMQKVGGEGEPF
ncbi:MAG: branched-chain-amino-acid transaminase [Candidatus Thermoplasmatota archaeon]|nr:branched-chain-amino-acid transaminase [Candidatus Thermoplasmatota archaeon]